MASFTWGAADGGGSGSGGVTIVNLYDPVDTTLPNAAPLLIDNVLVTSGMNVLFSALLAGNNQVYQATVVGPTVFWAVQTIFDGVVSPSAGMLVSVAEGDSFGGQVGKFDGTTWLFNYAVRYFNGVDYYEQSSLNTSTLTDNTAAGTVFSVAFLGSQNIMVNYSIIRGSTKEIGVLPITTDGVDAAISSVGSTLPSCGVTFDAVISGANLVLQYTTTSTGSDATMKYYLVRWSDAPGGPAGPPSYSGGSSNLAAGVTGNIQFNAAGIFAANSNFNYDTVNNIFSLGGAQFSIVYSAAILDNQAVPLTVVTIPAALKSYWLDVQVVRGTNVSTSTFYIATDGAVGLNSGETYSESGTTGVSFSTILSGGDIELQYTSTSTGSGGTLKYMYRGF